MGEIQSHTHPVSKEFGCGHIMTLCTAGRGRGGMSFQHCFYFCFFEQLYSSQVIEKKEKRKK